jgi:HPt (histidine-containing phosphotransfer) domain-containing protein
VDEAPLSNVGSTPSQNETYRCVASIPGLDIEQGLNLFRGSLKKYTQMLILFADTHADDAMLLNKAMLNNDLSTLKSISHTLKSSAGNVAVLGISELAAALNKTLHMNADQEVIELWCNSLISALRHTIEYIETTLREKRPG